MISLNYVIVSGRVTQDPEVREVGQAKKRKLAKFGIACNREYAAAGGKKTETMFIDIQTWENQANYIEKFLHKGDSCVVEGSLCMEQWRTKLGEMKSKIVIRAQRLQKDYRKSRENEYGGDFPDAEENTPPTNGHRYKRSDCNPNNSAPVGSDQPPADAPMDDDGVVPF